MIIADSGIIIRIAAKDISKIGRDTQGVRVMKLTEGKVAVVAITPHGEEKDDEEESAEGTIDESGATVADGGAEDNVVSDESDPQE